MVVVGFKVFKERNVGNNRLLLSELRHLKNGPAMVFWSMFDLTRAAPANTPRPVASWVKTIRPIFDLLDHEPHRGRESLREEEEEQQQQEQEAERFFFFFFFGMAFNIVYLLVVLRRVGPIESTKNWVMKFWKYLPNGWGIEIGVFWVMNNEWWMMSDEWRKLSEEW